MRTLGRREFVTGVVLGTLSGCLDGGAAPPVEDDVVTPTTPPATPSTPAVATADAVTSRIEAAPLVRHEGPGFSFVRPENWQQVSAADDAVVQFEYATADGRVLGELRAWGSVNTAYDDVAAAEAETVTRLTGADHEILGRRSVTLPDDRPGRVVDYALSTAPVRGSTVVTLAGPWLLRLVVLVHEDAYTSRLADVVDAVLASLAFSS